MILLYGCTTVCLIFHLLKEPGLFSVWHYSKQSHHEHVCAQAVVWTQLFVSLGWKTRSAIVRLHSDYICGLLRHRQTVFRVADHFTFPLAIYEWWSFSTSIQAFVGVIIFYLRNSSKHIVIPNCFKFAFAYWIIMLNIFLCALCNLNILFSEMLCHLFCSVYNWFVCFLLSIFQSSLYIFDSSPESEIWHGNIFYQSIACLFTSKQHLSQSKSI